MKTPWKTIETAPKKGYILVAWPAFKLDIDGNLTSRPAGKPFIGVARVCEDGSWDEPEAMNAVGDYYGDDFEYGDPTHWMPLPAPPEVA